MLARCGFSPCARALFLAVLLCVGTVPLCADFNFANFSSTTGINFVGSAAQSGTALRITPATFSQAGAAWFTTKQYVQGGFTQESMGENNGAD